MSEEWGMIRSFGIDKGELRDLSQQDCFVLGYELAKFDRLLSSKRKTFDMLAHASNIDRMKAYAQRKGRTVKIAFAACDQSEDWITITVTR